MADEKKIELWDGFSVKVERLDLLSDYDFIKDLQKKAAARDISYIEQLFYLIGGEATFEKVREHIIEEKGVFDINELAKISEKLMALFPKASSPSRKSW